MPINSYNLIIIYFLIIAMVTFGIPEETKIINLCKKLEQLHKNDQKYRGLAKMQDPFFNILDSIKLAHGISNEQYGNLTRKQQLEYGKMARKLVNYNDYFEIKEQDSLMKLQTELDSINTLELIKIVKKHGYPNITSLNCKNYAAPFLVFGHAPKRFWPEIKYLMQKEKENIPEGDYNYITWHINSRKGIPLKTKSGEVLKINVVN